uniref:PDZ domain-containing protein n=1 Tax=Heterorhabditis bacteriophora TaxID=37862 RepID=A0A1I7XBD0_HETBA
MSGSCRQRYASDCIMNSGRPAIDRSMLSPSKADTLLSSNTAPNTIVEKAKTLSLDDTINSATMEEALREGTDISDGGMSSVVLETPPAAVNQPFPATSTKVYYHIDDEPTPYLTEIHVPPDLITLGDVKRVLMRSNFKYYCKAVDPDTQNEVKAEIRDDMERLHRSSNGRFELFLLTTEGSTHSDGGSSGLPKSNRHHMVPGPAPTSMYHLSQNAYRQAVHQYENSLLSTDSESMISAPMPQYLKGSLNRRQFQPQYLVEEKQVLSKEVILVMAGIYEEKMANSSRFSPLKERQAIITTHLSERTSFLKELLGERKNSARSIIPIFNTTNVLNRGKVGQIVNWMEKASLQKKPPLAEPEVVEVEEKRKTKKRYIGNITSTRFLNSIFSSSSRIEGKKKDLDNRLKMEANHGVRKEPILLCDRISSNSIDTKLKLMKAVEEVPVKRRLKKRQSEGVVGVESEKNKRLSIADTDNFFSFMKHSGRPRSTIVDVSSLENRKVQLKDGEEFALRQLKPRSGERFSPSLIVQRKTSPISTSGTDQIEKRVPSRRRPLSVVINGSNMKSDRKIMTSSRSLCRTMTMIESKILPPLYENLIHEEKDDSLISTNKGGNSRLARKYIGSHSTSTYQGKKDSAPDATPRRHLIGHRGRRFEDSTITSESDARMFSDEDDRGSTTTDITSVSRQHENMYRKRRSRRQYRRPSRASSFSSITESSMSLDVNTVILNMDTVNFLGISIVGQSSARGAVALDGRIEAGDMILQVNDISFDNFTNDQAVDVLRLFLCSIKIIYYIIFSTSAVYKKKITGKKYQVVEAMAMPSSGLDIKNRTWLKIPIPMSFLVNKITFTEQCYYVLGEECADFARYRANPEDVMAQQQAQRWQWTTGGGGAKAPSMVSDVHGRMYVMDI